MKSRNLGKILGAIGLVLLLSSLITFLIGYPVLGIAKIGLGLAFIAFYAVTHVGSLGQTATSRGTFYVLVSAVSAVLVLAAIVFANYIAARQKIRWDLTKNQIHTLAPDTLQTLDGLKQDVEVVAFYGPGEPEYRALEELFDKYGARSGHFKRSFVDPIKEPLKVKEFGIREGAARVIVRQGATESRFQELTEEGLTNALVKVTRGKTKKIYFVVGHGESGVDEAEPTGLSDVKKRMENEGLQAEKLNLAAVSEVLADAQAVVVAGPAKPFQPGEVETLRKYLDAGGKALVMVEPLIASGLEPLLKSWGIEAQNALIVDPASRLFGASEAIPVVQEYPDQEIARNFDLNTVYPTARPLTVTQNAAGIVTGAVANSMASAWAETKPQGKIQPDPDEQRGPLTVVAKATKATAEVEGKRSEQARLVVAGDRDFATNKYRTVYGNEDFFLNSLNWLAEQTERITIRPRTRDASRLYLTETQQASIFFVALDVLPVSLLVVGLAVWLARRSR